MMNRKMASLIAASALVFVLTGCGSSSAPAPAGGSSAPAAGNSAPAAGSGKADAAKGKEAFAGTCSSCHGQDAKGLPNLGKNLVVKTDWMKQADDAALTALIAKGRPSSDPVNTTKIDMPSKGGNPALSDEDIANIVAYIRSIQK